MAAACVSLPPQLPLEAALQLDNLHRSNVLYNSLLDDHQQPPVADEHITNLAALFVRHKADKVFGLHLIHGHFQVPKDTVMLGTNYDNYGLRWAKPVAIDKIDRATVHGHIFTVSEDGLCPYELQDGPLPDLSEVGEGFLADSVDYLTKNGLTGLLGLQILGCGGGSMFELILEQGTVMLNSTVAKNVVPPRVTGWKFESDDGIPRVCLDGETHTALDTGNHKVDWDHLLPTLENVEDLKAVLTDVGVM